MSHARRQLLAKESAIYGLFLSDRNREKHTAVAILRTIICYLLEMDQRLLPILSELRKSNSHDLRSLDKLENIIRDLLSCTEIKSTYVIIDGIDEIDDKERRRLMQIILRLSSVSFRLLISSRA